MPRKVRPMTDVSTTAETEKKRAIAEHILLGSDGKVVEDIEQAHGIRYVDKASALSVDYTPTDPNALRMLAVFGAKTLATNVASATRGPDKDGTAQEQIDAIQARFDWIETQKSWLDPSREVGARWDIDTLATAAVNVSVANGKVPNEDDKKAAAFAKFKALMEDPAKGKGNVTAIRSVAGVEAEYKKLQGKTAKTADDLAAMLGD